MIAVSDSFKKAIKSENREIHGYVEVDYQKKPFETTVTNIPTQLEMFDENGIINGSKIMQKYATLENNYTLLDGSFMVWNENIILNDGYASNNIFQNIQDTITITNTSTNISTKGITIYFRDNLPFDFTVTITTTDNEEIIDNVIGNQSYIYQYLFIDEQYISSVNIDIIRMEHSDNRLRIAYVDFNLSDLYEGDELVKFEVTEELDLLLENVPVNNCIVTLNNYPDNNGASKFDVLNPKGIIGYLTDETTIKPYIGVLTELNGIEYVPMGVFYLNDWQSDTNGNVTFNCYDILNKLKGKQMIVDTDFMFDVLMVKDVGNMIKNQIDAEVDFPLYSFPWTNDDLKQTDLFEYIAHVMINFLYYDSPYDTLYPEFRKFYTNRYGVITLNKIEFAPVTKISQAFLKQDLDYQIKNGIKYLNIKSVAYGSTNVTDSNVISEQHTLNNTEEYVWFARDDRSISYVNSFTYNVVSGSGSASMIGYNRFMVLVKFTGTVGSVINVTCNAHAGTTHSTPKNATIINNIEDGDTITIDLSDYKYILDANYLKNTYFNLSKKYKISAQTMGDPSLEIGDTISIQTRYKDVNNGYKDMIITKQQFTFDGGLQCNLEGIGD